MAGKIEWLEMIPEAIVELVAHPDAMIGRKEVERLLGVKGRQAQRILEKAGATTEGKLTVMSAGDFALYLDHLDNGCVEREKERRRRFAEKFAAMRRERIAKPPLFVEVDNVEVLRLGYAGLPEGIEFGRGTLTIRFQSAHQLLQKLALLACAMQGDGDPKEGVFPELERRTDLVQ
jgi:hypothetical protein